MERRLRFVQRASALVTAIAALIAAGWWWQARQTEVVRKLATENLTLAQRADANATLAQRNEAAAREGLYAADINLAYQALQANNLRLARSLLQNHVPQPGQPDLRGFEWRYLWQQCQSEELFSIQTHISEARVLALAPDGRRAVVGGIDVNTKVLDLQLRREIASLPDTNRVLSLSFSPSGDLLAAGYRTDVRVLDGRSFAELRSLADAAAPARFSPDGKWLLTRRRSAVTALQDLHKENHELILWDTATWIATRSVSLPASGAASGPRDLYVETVFARDGRSLVVLAGDTIRLLQLPELEEIRVLPDKIPIKRYSRPFIALSPDNHTLAIPDQEEFGIRLWDLDGNRELRVLTGHTDMVIAAAFSPDGTMLATCSPDQTIRLWNVDTGELLNTFRGQADEVFDVAFSSDGKLLASLGCYDAVVKVWDPMQKPRPESFRDSLTPAGFEADGGLLAIRKREAVVLDPATFQVSPVNVPLLRTQANYGLYLNSVSSDGRFQAVWGRDKTNAGDYFVEVWDRREAKRLSLLPAISPIVSFAPKRELIATSTTNELGETSSVIWQLPAGTSKWVFTNSQCRAIAPDEKHLLMIDAGGRLLLWKIDGDEVKPVLTIPGSFGDTVLSPDGRLLATVESGDIQIRRLPTAEVVGVLKGHTRKGPRLAFSPDGRTLASIADDRTVRLWHIATQRELLQFQSPAEDQGPFFLEFSPDGRALAATRVDDRGPVTWLYFAPSLAEIAVAEGRDYRAAAADNPTTWLAVAKALARKESWQAALDAFNEVLNYSANRDDLAWLRTNALSQRVEILKRLDRLEKTGTDEH
jgi:WD40 repeat protein